MKVFVTGATGFVGSAVVQELIQAGHTVLGLARSDAGAASLASMGAEVHRGSLEDLDSLRAGARAADGVIHTAFIHDFSKFAENCEIDRRALQALGAELKDSGRLLIATSGAALIRSGSMGTETDPPIPESAAYPRSSDATAIALSEHGVNAAVVRLPPTVHGAGDHGFVPQLIEIARSKGMSVYVGDGMNRWPAVHRQDAAVVYRRALEKGVAGVRYHAIAEEGVLFKDIAALIGQRLNVPVVSKSAEEAQAHFGWFAGFAGMDVPTSSAITRDALDWYPKRADLLTDMREAGYFA
jgi:nucleoside-diphosphate-sugar epimerase